MKKITLVMAALLIGLTSATASDRISDRSGKKLEITKRYRFVQPILFVERGVEFLVFPNGEFDFNTEINNSYQDVFYSPNNSRRSSINATLSVGANKHIGFTHQSGTLIQYDRLGHVRRVGNVFINYDYQGRVKRIGSVYMKYRHDRLKQVGGLTIQYNRWGGMVAIRGHVNHHNEGCGFCGMTSCSANHFDDRYADRYDKDYRYDDFDDDIYYYGKNGKSKKIKKRKRIK